MAWYHFTGARNDVVLSSRVRLARSIEGFPFGDKLTEDKRSELIGLVTGALAPAGLESVELSALTESERDSLAEKRLVTPEFARSTAFRALLLSPGASSAPTADASAPSENGGLTVSVTIGGKDHVRIQTIVPGLALDKALEKAFALDDLLDAGADVAYSEAFGYLNENAADLGTGLRASVLLHLPALSFAHRVRENAHRLNRQGLSVRPVFPDEYGANGSLFRLSGAFLPGLTEEEVIAKLTEAAGQLADEERKLRETLKKDRYDDVCDRSMRALGVLKNAYLMSASELVRLWSEARLGVTLGMIEGVSLETLDTLLFESMDAALTDSGNGGTSKALLRAKKLREALR